jgi:hypothetical protein
MIEETDNQELEIFEDVVNEYLIQVRELEYSLVHFIKKSNKSTALQVRNVQRELSSAAKEFKTLSINYFGDKA